MRRHFRLVVVAVSLLTLAVAGAAGFSTDTSSTYSVQPGDSLWAISQRTGVSVNALASANGMNVNDLLLIGRTLTIPAASGQASPSTPAGSTSSTDSSSTYSSEVGSYAPFSFCSSFVSGGGPYGVLPQVLADSPDRLALQPYFEQWANYYGLSLPLLEAVDWQESGWQEGVVSVTGAVGIGQIEPYTQTFIENFLIGEHLNAQSVSDNIRMSASLLAYLAHVEGNNQCNTIAAYYEGTVNLSQYGVFPDSQAYVASVQALIPRFE